MEWSRRRRKGKEMGLAGGRKIEVSIALEEVTPGRIASTIWLNRFFCLVLSNEIEEITLLQRDSRLRSC